MSEVSVISNQYKTVVDTTDRVNNSIIALKKKSILSSEAQPANRFQLSEEELKFAKEYLLHFLEFLKKLKDDPTIDSEYLPTIVIKDFQLKIINSVPFFEDEVKSIIDAITADKNLGKLQFNLLDKMASTLDNERTFLFKKLRSARG